MNPNSAKLLVCDDDPLFRKTLEIALRDYGTVTLTANSDEALQILQKRSFDLMVLDIQMRTKDEGLRALPKIRALDDELAVVVMSGLRDFQTVREAMLRGATDYLPKDFDPEEFKLAIERCLEKRDLTQTKRKQNYETLSQHLRQKMVGSSGVVEQVRKVIEKFRVSPANVLITGETGTGKEIAARSLRKTLKDGSLEPFVAIDAATLHAQTAESLLFGHEKGAFTGADSTKRGLFEEADGGVLFFDEIGNLPLPIQAKLLRVLQEKEITRLGSTKVIPLEFRIIAATNRDLEEMSKRNEFLPDLLQRLNVLPIHLPPLRDRLSDIAELVPHFLKLRGAERIAVTAEALEVLKRYSWPGNIRELAALLDYSLAMIDGDVIDVADLHPKLRDQKPTKKGLTRGETLGFYDRIEEFEKSILDESYKSHQGNVSQMALTLGMDRSHLHTKLKQYGIHSARTKN